MTTIPAYSIGGITRPELFLDPNGNIVLDPAAQSFADQYGLKALYLGCPPGTPYPPVTGLLLTTPVDTDSADNSVLEGAAANTPVHITASAHDIIGLPITYSLTGDSSGGGFQINSATGVVTVANPTKVDFETAPGHAYTVTVQASDGIFTTSQNFTIAVGDVAPTTPTDTDATANTGRRCCPRNHGRRHRACDRRQRWHAHHSHTVTSRGERRHHQPVRRRSPRPTRTQGRNYETPAAPVRTTLHHHRAAATGAAARVTQTFTITVTDVPVSAPPTRRLGQRRSLARHAPRSHRGSHRSERRRQRDLRADRHRSPQPSRSIPPPASSPSTTSRSISRPIGLLHTSPCRPAMRRAVTSRHLRSASTTCRRRSPQAPQHR